MNSLSRVRERFMGFFRQSVSRNPRSNDEDIGSQWPHYLRNIVSELYINGDGIEIGALNTPLKIDSRKANVRYLDRMGNEGLQKHYHDCTGIIDVDIIDNGEKLSTIADSSLDFIIANHMLEHSVSPITTIEVFLKRLRQSGIIYLAVPNKSFTFDAKRQLTSFDHLADDHNMGDKVDNYPHYIDWVRYSENIANEDEMKKRIDLLLSINYSIHYHVWDDNSFLDFLLRSNILLSNIFSIELYLLNGPEIIIILRKK